MEDRIDEANEDNNARTVALHPEQIYFADLLVEDVTVKDDGKKTVANIRFRAATSKTLVIDKKLPIYEIRKTKDEIIAKVDKLTENHIPSEISYTAGTFGCNQIFYHTMHKLHQAMLPTKAGFIHVPCLPNQASKLQRTKKRNIPSMDINITIEALKLAIKETIANL